MMQNRSCIAALALCLTTSLLIGCASQPIAHKDPRDPWERMNRGTYAFNDTILRKAGLPFARGYNRVVPKFIRAGVSNFMSNVNYPQVFVNDFLQAKFKTGFSDTGRFVMNSTVGIGGLLDPASSAGLAKNDNDFGRTLGTWGVHGGPYLVLPFLGPSGVRDALGKVPDSYLSPFHYARNNYVTYGSWVLYGIDELADTVLPAYDLLDAQHPYDPYAFMRNAYLQRREYQIHGTSSKSEEDLEKELEESAPDDSSSGSAPAKSPQPGK
jgi:phospholipid-binding lipoprotein MlaA